MHLVWHLIGKDLRRDRWALVLWATLYVLQVCLALSLVWRPALEPGEVMLAQGISAALVALQMLATYALTVRLVQSDPAVGSNAFWLTRPIPIGQMLAAKLGVALVGFALIPVLLLLPWWIVAGVTPGQMVWLAVETVGWQWLVIAPALLLASLTRDIGRVVLWSILLVVGGLTWVGTVSLSVRMPLMGPEVVTAGNLFASRMWAAGLLTVLIMPVIAVHQIATRRLMRSLAMVAGWVIVVGMIGNFSRWDVTRSLSTPAQVQPQGMATRSTPPIEVKLAPHQFDGAPDAPARQQLVGLQVRWDLSGLPLDLTARLVQSRHVLEWPGGPRITGGSNPSWGSRYGLSHEQVVRLLDLKPVEADEETEKWIQAKRKAWRERANRSSGMVPPRYNQVYRPLPSLLPPGVVRLGDGISISRSVRARLKEEPAQHSATLQFSLQRARIATEAGLGQATSWAGSTGWFRLLSTENLEQRGLRVTVLRTTAVSANYGLWLAGGDMTRMRRWRRLENDQGMLVNRSEGTYTYLAGRGATAGAIIGGVDMLLYVQEGMPRQVIRNDKWVTPDPAWREHCSLVFLNWEDAGFVEVSTGPAALQLQDAPLLPYADF